MKTEPLFTVATLTAAATALLGLLVAFGVDLTEEKQAAIMACVAVIAPLVVATIARSKVTPVPPTE